MKDFEDDVEEEVSDVIYAFWSDSDKFVKKVTEVWEELWKGPEENTGGVEN